MLLEIHMLCMNNLFMVDLHSILGFGSVVPLCRGWVYCVSDLVLLRQHIFI